MFVIIKIPTGICNIIAGIIYAGLTYLILKMFISKIIKLPTSDFGMPKFAIKIRWILIAVLLPFVIKGSYLLIFNGKYVSSNMNGNQMFNTLSTYVITEYLSIFSPMANPPPIITTFQIA